MSRQDGNGSRASNAGSRCQVVLFDGGSKSIARQVAMLIGPLGRLGNLVPVGGRRQYRGKQGIRIESDSRDQLIELRGAKENRLAE
jgi:hypothetical protein